MYYYNVSLLVPKLIISISIIFMFLIQVRVMKFGYARVSKNEQSLDAQIEKLKQAGCDEIICEKISGVKDVRPQLNLLMTKLRKGDTVCVVRLDRLGRRMIKLVELINNFKKIGVEFISLENNLNTTTSLGMLLFNICAAFSEMERELIRERVLDGLITAREKGRKGGRPKSLTKEKTILLKALIQSGDLSVKQICEAVNISRSVYYRSIKSDIK